MIMGLVAADLAKFCTDLLHLVGEGALLAAELFCNLPVRKLIAQHINDAVCIRVKLTESCDELLQKYGATKLSLVDPKDYEALLKDAEVLSHAT